MLSSRKETRDEEVACSATEKGAVLQGLQNLKADEVPPPPMLTSGAQASSNSTPGAFYAQPEHRCSLAEDNDEIAMTATEEREVPPPDRWDLLSLVAAGNDEIAREEQEVPPPVFAVQAELVSASLVDESPPSPQPQQQEPETISEIYKAEPLATSSCRKYSLLLIFAVVCSALTVLALVIAVLLLRKEDSTQEPSNAMVPSSPADSSPGPVHANFARSTQHMVFLGTKQTRTCLAGNISITIRCESEDAVLVVDESNLVSHNMLPWEFENERQAKCTQQPSRNFSYVAFTCAWNNKNATSVSVELDDVAADCKSSLFNPYVMVGVSVGQLCPGPFGNVVYKSSATSCHAHDAFRGGCAVVERCTGYCVMPGWGLVEPIMEEEDCTAGNRTVLDDLEAIVQDHQYLNSVSDEEG